MVKKPPKTLDHIKGAFELLSSKELKAQFNEANKDYLHWEKFRFKSFPKGVKPETAWALLKFFRSGGSEDLPLFNEKGKAFTYCLTKEQQKNLSYLDKYLAGNLNSNIGIPDDIAKNKLILNGLIEEAISSSQLEGASTTRKVAKRMIELGEEPESKDARMILNNFRGMSALESWKDRELSREFLLELHSIITEQTLDNSDEEGRFRFKNEGIKVVDNLTGEPVHYPPQIDEALRQIDDLCKFANTEEGEDYLHPFVKASILHFMIGYIHPFTDGNGRCARALFYWYLLKKGYWMFKFFTISTQIKKKEWNSGYAKAYLYTETDEQDTTYFVHYKIKLACRAIEDFIEYLERKGLEEAKLQNEISHGIRLNSRQIDILRSFKKNPNFKLTLQEYKVKNKISYETARSDLLEMSKLKLIEKLSSGRKFVFVSRSK